MSRIDMTQEIVEQVSESLLRKASDRISELEDKLNDTAAFLDQMADRLDKPATWARPRPADAADCRARARKLRGET